MTEQPLPPPHTIFKYPIGAPVNEFTLPVGAKVLHVHEQDGNPHVWVQQPTPGLERTMWHFEVQPTGVVFAPQYPYLGTVHIDWMVFHVYGGPIA